MLFATGSSNIPYERKMHCPVIRPKSKKKNYSPGYVEQAPIRGHEASITPETENERSMIKRRACALTLSPRSFLLLEHSFQLTPSPHCGLTSWPLLGTCSMHRVDRNLEGYRIVNKR